MLYPLVYPLAADDAPPWEHEGDAYRRVTEKAHSEITISTYVEVNSAPRYITLKAVAPSKLQHPQSYNTLKSV